MQFKSEEAVSKIGKRHAELDSASQLPLKLKD